MFQAITINHASLNGIVTKWRSSLLSGSKFTAVLKRLCSGCVEFGALIQPTIYLVVTTHPKWTNITKELISSLSNEQN
jgi:hypothetical protein